MFCRQRESFGIAHSSSYKCWHLDPSLLQPVLKTAFVHERSFCFHSLLGFYYAAMSNTADIFFSYPFSFVAFGIHGGGEGDLISQTFASLPLFHHFLFSVCMLHLPSSVGRCCYPCFQTQHCLSF